MKRSELGLIPLTYPMPTGRPPVVNRLALFGAALPRDWHGGLRRQHHRHRR